MQQNECEAELDALLLHALHVFGENGNGDDLDGPEPAYLYLVSMHDWLVAVMPQAANLIGNPAPMKLESTCGWYEFGPIANACDSSFFPAVSYATDFTGLPLEELGSCAEMIVRAIDIQVLFTAARQHDQSSYYYPPCVEVTLAIGPVALPPFLWLLKNYQRIMEQLLWPLDCEWSVSVIKGPNPVPGLIKEIEGLLADGHTLSLKKAFYPEKTSGFLIVLAVFLSVLDAVSYLRWPRSQPDRILKRYLALAPHLKKRPFRESFYEKLTRPAQGETNTQKKDASG